MANRILRMLDKLNTRPVTIHLLNKGIVISKIVVKNKGNISEHEMDRILHHPFWMRLFDELEPELEIIGRSSRIVNGNKP